MYNLKLDPQKTKEWIHANDGIPLRKDLGVQMKEYDCKEVEIQLYKPSVDSIVSGEIDEGYLGITFCTSMCRLSFATPMPLESDGYCVSVMWKKGKDNPKVKMERVVNRLTSSGLTLIPSDRVVVSPFGDEFVPLLLKPKAKTSFKGFMK